MPDADDRLLPLAGLSGPVAFSKGAGSIADGLRAVLVDWPKADVDPAAEPSVVVRRGRRTFSVARSRDGWRSQDSTEVSAICTAIVEIVADYVAAQDGLGSLHAAAAEFAGRLVVFPAIHRAGKSTLMTALSAAGHRIFADDLLPVDLLTLEGVATGCLPRLRMPLPDDAMPGLEAFVTAHTVLGDGYYAYVAGHRRVSHGERAPIGAVVLLDRRSEPGAAELTPAEPDEALLGLMMQDARQIFPAGETLERYHRLVSRARLYRLTYARLGDAVECLGAAFSHWPEEPAAPLDPPAFAGTLPPATPPSIGTQEGRYRRSPQGILRIVGASAFLVSAARNDIHHLNAIGLGLWNLLERPRDEEAIVEIVRGAFPDEPDDRVRRHVAAALRRLVDAGLVEDLQR